MMEGGKKSPQQSKLAEQKKDETECLSEYHDDSNMTDDDENENSDDDFVRGDSQLPSLNVSLKKSPMRNESMEKTSCVTRSEDIDGSLENKLCRRDEKRSKDSKSIFTYIKFSSCIVICAIAMITVTAFNFNLASNTDASSQPFNQLRLEIFENDLQKIINKFPQQNQRSWLDIKAGVMDVMNSSSKPWTFVLFSDEPTTVSCLAKLLGIASSKALQSEKSLILRPEDMGNEYGDAIDHLRPLILERKAVVVHDLLNIDPGAIQAFHTMCDRENPLVKEAIYILTIIAPGYKSSQRPEEFIENLLTDRFMNRVHEDKLQPLITRITDGPIIPVIPVNNPTGC